MLADYFILFQEDKVLFKIKIAALGKINIQLQEEIYEIVFITS